MSSDRKRVVEVRMIVIVVVDVTSTEFAETLTETTKNPSSVAEVVASEVLSNLESVPYIESVIVSPL